MYAIGEKVPGWRPADVPEHPRCKAPGCKRFIPDDKLDNVTKYCSVKCGRLAQRLRRVERRKGNGA